MFKKCHSERSRGISCNLMPIEIDPSRRPSDLVGMTNGTFQTGFKIIMKIHVQYVAKLANLSLSKGEQNTFERQLSEILSYVEKLREVDTKNVETTSQVTRLENVTREDETKPSISQDEALSNTKSKHSGLFKVPAILEE